MAEPLALPGLLPTRVHGSRTAPPSWTLTPTDHHQTPSDAQSLTEDCRSEKEGVSNNEVVINPDRHAALTITFQLLVVGGQIIPFHPSQLPAHCTSPRYMKHCKDSEQLNLTTE